MPWAGLILLLAGAGALIAAFSAEHLFGIQACSLCYWERVPYVAVIFFSALALLWRPYGRAARVLIALCSIAFLVSMGQAIFHTGVEQHWWADLSSCALEPLEAENLTELRNQLLAQSTVPCDQISWTFLGVSMVIWNVFFSLAMALFAEESARRGFKEGGVAPCFICQRFKPKA